MKKVLKQIRSAQRPERRIESFPEEATTSTRTTLRKEDTVQTISHSSLTFSLAANMFQMDVMPTQMPLEDLA
jgi:hypothetical protein